MAFSFLGFLKKLLSGNKAGFDRNAFDPRASHVTTQSPFHESLAYRSTQPVTELQNTPEPSSDDPYFEQKTMIIPVKDRADGMTFYNASHKFAMERAQVRSLVRAGKPPTMMPKALDTELGKWMRDAYLPSQQNKIDDLIMWYDQWHTEAERIIVMGAAQGRTMALKAMADGSYAYATKRVATLLARLWLGDEVAEAEGETAAIR